AYSKTYSVSDTSKTLSLSSDELEKLVEESGSSLSGDSPKVRLRIKPGGTSQTSSSTVYNNNDNVATTTDEITVYRVSVAEKNHIKGAYLYGLPGREVKITATAESGYKFVSWDDDSSAAATRTVTISTDTSKNSYTATASTTGSSTPKNSSTGGSGNAGANLDKVPKTGEGNTRLLILMVAIISASVAASILLSTLPAKKKIGKEEGVDDKDIFHKKD
ncbi:MAG: hypothetical protein IKS87_03560, partial [Lachnospiraceae bacterium]|nr:hypothetical protein [Lachnospiraceae bacterium]